MNQDELYMKLSQQVHRHFGLDFRRPQWKSLGHYLERAAKEIRRDPDLPAVLEWVSKEKLTPAEYHVLTKNLTIGETYFFREKAAFSLLTEKILKPIAQSGSGKPKSLRIWSAGCSTGEEPYSIAITLKEALKDLPGWDIKIVATDLNPSALEKARKGWYRSWSFRDTPPDIMEKYFQKKADGYQIAAPIQAMVEFRQLNLIGDEFHQFVQYPASYDVIFCRNVLMYFSPELILKVTARFSDALKTDGWFVTSQVELNDVYFAVFARRQHSSGLFYQKSDSRQSAERKADVHSIRDGASKRLLPKPASVSPSADTSSVIQSRFQVPALKSRIVPEPSSSDKANQTGSKQVPDSGDSGRPKFQAHRSGEAMSAVQLLANSGRYAEAEVQLRDLLQSDSENVQLLLLLATVLSEQRKTTEADAQLVKVLYLEPDNLAALFSRSRLLKQLGKADQSRKYLSRLLSLLASKPDSHSISALDDLNVGLLRKLADAEFASANPS